ncbi:MAG: hypothetical protein ACRDJL_01140, partial [Actinomycetota bacterium]
MPNALFDLYGSMHEPMSFEEDDYDDCFDEWIGCVGPARFQLLQPLRSELRTAAPLDVERVRWATEPLSWLIERAAVSGIPAEGRGARHEFTEFMALGNARFGWDPQPTAPDGERGFGELHALHLLALDIGAIEHAGARDTITWVGRVLLGHPAKLWRAASHALISTGGFFAAQCELVLASLLQQAGLDENEAGLRLGGAIIEAAGGEDYLELVDETGKPRGEAVVELVAIGMRMTRALGTA